MRIRTGSSESSLRRPPSPPHLSTEDSTRTTPSRWSRRGILRIRRRVTDTGTLCSTSLPGRRQGLLTGRRVSGCSSSAPQAEATTHRRASRALFRGPKAPTTSLPRVPKLPFILPFFCAPFSGLLDRAGGAYPFSRGGGRHRVSARSASSPLSPFIHPVEPFLFSVSDSMSYRIKIHLYI